MKPIVVFLLTTITVMITCTTDRIAGGSGTETTNSFAYLTSGTPAQNSTVYIIDPVNWVSQIGSGSYIVDSTVTGEDGSFSFEFDKALQSKSYAIQINHDSSGLCRSEISFKDIDGEKFTLGRYRSFHGQVQGGKTSMRLLIGNTTFHTVVNGDGSFKFDKIPEGLYGVFAETNAGLAGVGTAKIVSDSSGSVQYSIPPDRHFLLTDFECGYKSPISEISGIELFWYLFSDSANKGYDYQISKWVINNSKDFSKSGNSSVNSFTGSESDGSQTLNFEGMLDPQCEFPYTGLGMVLYTDGDRGVNLQSVDSLRFNAQGKGSMRVIFIAEHPVNKVNHRFTKMVTLSQLSEDVSISLKSNKWDLSPDDSLKITWEDVCQRVRMVEFAFYGSENEPGSNVRFVVDNVVFVSDGVVKSLAGISGR